MITTKRIVICFISSILAFLMIISSLHPLKLITDIHEKGGGGKGSIAHQKTKFARGTVSMKSKRKFDLDTSKQAMNSKIDLDDIRTVSEKDVTTTKKEKKPPPQKVESNSDEEIKSSEVGKSSNSNSTEESETVEDKNLIKTTKDAEGNPLPFPIYEPTEDKAPGDGYTTYASDQLLCRENVISFVINATDVRDECEGLRRAFDSSCQTIEFRRRQLSTTEQVSDWIAASRRRLAKSLSLPTKKRVNDQMIKDSLLLQDTPSSFLKNKPPIRTHLNHRTKMSLKHFVSTPEAEELKTCCASILSTFHEHCDRGDDYGYDDERLFVIVFVITLCGLVKSLIRHFRIRWLPEAAGCILVGVVFGFVLNFVPHFDFYFDEKLFLRLMLPPIVFEASLSINKQYFRKYATPILIFACVGTFLASFLTAIIVHYGTYYFQPLCPNIPMIESLAFGALISSIDPIAVLSVLSNMGIKTTDAIYILIFGESLLNDGVAVILFETLSHFLNGEQVMDSAAMKAASLHFVSLSFGSIFVGLSSGCLCVFYFWAMHGCHSPMVEILSFCCWALIPYYICDGVGWSGIVAIVAAGFIMDIYVVGEYTNPEVATENNYKDRCKGRLVFSKYGQISSVAKNHLHFVTSVIATFMETSIFAYLGLFLFKSRYHWNFVLTVIAIFSCMASRAIMIASLTCLSNWLNKRNGRMYKYLRRGRNSNNNIDSPSSSELPVVIDKRMQVVLWFAGLRGAMSFALVENIPLLDTASGHGTPFKPELKAMTSASIIFTVFVLGGGTFYAMEHMGMSLNRSADMEEDTTPLVKMPSKRNSEDFELTHRGSGLG